MTVIAYDGKTLAADRRTLSSNSDMLTPPGAKVFVVPGIGAIATCGNKQPDARKRAVIAKLSIGETEDLPESVGGLALLQTGAAFIVGDGYALPVLGPHAMGSGHEVARGAMAAGADAVRAVEITNSIVVTCGDGVDSYTPEEAA